MNMLPFIDLKSDFNSHLRSRRRARHARRLYAFLGLALFLLLAGLTIGIVTAVGSVPHGIVIAAIILWGLWSFRYLTR